MSSPTVQVTKRDDGKMLVEWDSDGERYYYYCNDADLEPLPRSSDLQPCVYARRLDSRGEPLKGEIRLLNPRLPSVSRLVNQAKNTIRDKQLVGKAEQAHAEQRHWRLGKRSVRRQMPLIGTGSDSEVKGCFRLSRRSPRLRVSRKL